MMRFKRAFLIVLDSFGIGAMPDAAAFGDEGANTIRSVAASDKFNVPTMAKMGLFHIDGVDCKGIDKERQPSAAYCRLAGYDIGPLGNCRPRIKKPLADISAWFSG